MPMDRSLYSDDWETIALQVKTEAAWTCRRCGKPCYRPGQPALDRRRVLTVHHKDHDPGNNSRDNLEALCAPCHLREEVRYRSRTAWRRAAEKIGQTILPEMEETHGV